MVGRTEAWLLVRHDAGIHSRSLVPGVPIVIGRAATVDMPLSCNTLSRRHARVLWDGDRLWIEDLGSRNGTFVGDRRIVNQEAVEANREVRLGGLSVWLQVTGGPDDGASAWQGFAAVVNAEIDRARTFGRSLGILCIVPGSEAPSAADLLPRVAGLLRPVDRVDARDPSALFALVPESDRRGLLSMGQRVLDVLRGTGIAIRAGVAAFPDSTDSPEELLELALLAAKSSDPGGAVGMAPSRLGHSTGHSVPSPTEHREVVHRSAVMAELLERAKRVAEFDVPVLLQGETGTGKEVLARFIHESSSRKARRMVSLNCGAIPSTLVEATLFGAEKGAFTGAVQKRLGLFEAAHGSTLLLDEIGELPMGVQVALLRVIETGRITRVGGTREIEVDVRIVAATHRNLEMMARAGSFRWDLLYRINTVILALPPLRQRPEDIEVLARFFLPTARGVRDGAPLVLGDDTLRALEAYDWPGNVRELRNAIEQAVINADGAEILPRHLDSRLHDNDGPITMEVPAFNWEPAAASDDGAHSFKDQVQAFEKKLMVNALESTAGNQSEAARKLRMPLRTFTTKMNTYGLRPDKEE